MGKHPEWGTSKFFDNIQVNVHFLEFSRQMHDLLNDKETTLQKAQELKRKFNKIFEETSNSRNFKESMCYQILSPFDDVPSFNEFVDPYLKYVGRRSHDKSRGPLPARYYDNRVVNPRW
jgi:hypothetical protein